MSKKSIQNTGIK